MDPTLVFVLATLTVTMLAVTLHAWRMGNERRDVALLGAIGALLGVGTAAAVF